jgi:N-acetyl-anhydromuramyl-L-alanine amidase AmpD
MVNEVPEAQLMELVKLIREIRNRYGDIPVMYHRDFNATSCPGDKFPYAKLNELISAKSIDRAIAKLVKLGVISSPDYWQANAKAGQTVKGEYVEAVLIRLVERGIL